MTDTLGGWLLHVPILLRYFIVAALWQGMAVLHVFYLTPASRPASLGNELNLVKDSECVGKNK